MASGKFAMAVHALAVLAQDRDGYPSEYLAGSVNTHAVFLRRVLRRLAEGGLIEAREGRGGGYRLSRPAGRVTLAEVYRLVEPDGPLTPSPCEPNGKCPVGAGMRAAFAAFAAAARTGLEGALAGQTVADVARTAVRRGKATRAAAPRGTAPRDTAPRATAPRDTAPRGTAPRDFAPRAAAPRDTAP